MIDTKTIRLFQIYYDDVSYGSIQSGFEPLDNCDGPKEFREIVPIFKYLKENDFDDHEWLGFFSPKFADKTGLGAEDVLAEVTGLADDIDACLFTSQWSEIAFFQNIWEHGEYCHPGLTGLCQMLADRAGYNIDLMKSVSTLNSSVFSHYIVARGKFWREWRRIVEIYLTMISENHELFILETLHEGGALSMHPFIVERVPSMILQDTKFRAIASDRVLCRSSNFINQMLNPHAQWARELTDSMSEHLLSADRMKMAYAASGENKYLDEYWRFRLWAPARSGHINLTECALSYIRERCHHATMNGIVMRDAAA